MDAINFVTSAFGSIIHMYKNYQIAGVSLFAICIGFIILSIVIFGLINVVRTNSGNSAGSYRSSVDRERRKKK